MEWDLRSILTGEFMGTDSSRRFLLIFAPALLMLIAIPLIRKKIPKNAFYGFRTPKTMAGSDEQWYRINREGGIAIFIAGSISLLASIFVPVFVRDQSQGISICSEILVASMLIACGIETVKHWK
jgi:uncharacterized membrane protein